MLSNLCQNFPLILFSAPLANFVAMQLSNRFIVFVGGILIALGFLLSMNATSIVYLYFSYGGLVGKAFLSIKNNPSLIEKSVKPKF